MNPDPHTPRSALALRAGYAERYVHYVMRALLLALIANTGVAAELGADGEWDITCGRWEPAPLNVAEITVKPNIVDTGGCDMSYSREARFETRRYGLPNSIDVYDGFLFRLNTLVGGRPCSRPMAYMLMEIPKNLRTHARFSFYLSQANLPTEEQRLDPSKFYKGKISFSAGFGLRSAEPSCSAGLSK